MNDVLKIKCVIYTRAQQHNMEASVRQQLEDMRGILIRESCLEEVKVFNDYCSAISKDKPGFSSMLEFLKQGKAKVILCTSLDRLGRDFKSFLPIFDLIENHGVEICTLNGRYTKGSSEIFIHVGLVDAFHSYHSEITKRGIALAKARRTMAPYGYNSKDESEKVKAIYYTCANRIRRDNKSKNYDKDR